MLRLTQQTVIPDSPAGRSLCGVWIGNPVSLQRLICFTIAHRLSTIKNADRIIVIHNRRIIEEGTFAELIAKNDGFVKKLNLTQRHKVAKVTT